MKYQRTCLEERMYHILNTLGIEFTEQYSTPTGFVIDFSVIIERPNKRMAIETDGTQFHSSAEQKRRDNFRDYKLKQEGWTVIRFGETFDEQLVKDRINPTLTKWGLQPA